MFRRLLDLVSPSDPAQAGRHAIDEPQLAAAGLLVEAAMLDERFEETERQRILELLGERFGLQAGEAAELLEAAQDKAETANQLFGFTRVVNEHFDHEGRVGLVEMLWEVVYADGELHDYEASLMRRVAGLIHVSDRESGDARKRALSQLKSKA